LAAAGPGRPPAFQDAPQSRRDRCACFFFKERGSSWPSRAGEGGGGKGKCVAGDMRRRGRPSAAPASQREPRSPRSSYRFWLGGRSPRSAFFCLFESLLFSPHLRPRRRVELALSRRCLPAAGGKAIQPVAPPNYDPHAGFHLSQLAAFFTILSPAPLGDCPRPSSGGPPRLSQRPSSNCSIPQQLPADD